MKGETSPPEAEPEAVPLPLALDRKPPRETRVKLSEIHLPSVYRGRTELVASIRAVGGLLQPVILSVDPKYGATYQVAAGRRRVAAIQAIAREDGVDPERVLVPAKVYEGLTKKELAIVTLQESNRDDNHLSHVEAIQKLVGAGLSEKQIADGMRWTPRRVRNYVAIGAGLEPALLKALGRGDMTLRAALEALKLPTDGRAALVALATAGGRVPIEVVRAGRAATARAAELPIGEVTFALPPLSAARVLEALHVERGRHGSGDHACGRCHPESDMLIEGFTCTYHRLLDWCEAHPPIDGSPARLDPLAAVVDR